MHYIDIQKLDSEYLEERIAGHCEARLDPQSEGCQFKSLLVHIFTFQIWVDNTLYSVVHSVDFLVVKTGVRFDGF